MLLTRISLRYLRSRVFLVTRHQVVHVRGGPRLQGLATADEREHPATHKHTLSTLNLGWCRRACLHRTPSACPICAKRSPLPFCFVAGGNLQTGYLPVAENASGRWRLDLESLNLYINWMLVTKTSKAQRNQEPPTRKMMAVPI